MIAITYAGFRTCFKLNKSNKDSRNSPNCKILEGLAFENLILADELFPKVL